MPDSEGLGEATALSGGALLDDGTLDPLLERLARLALVASDGPVHVSLTIATGGRYRTANPTGDEAVALDEIQYDLDDGPCLEAVRTGTQVAVSLDAVSARWPELVEAARQVGIRTVLSTPLTTDVGAPV